LAGLSLEWCGHSYLVIRTPDGVTLAVDPHDGGSVGLPECRVQADYTLVTHRHFDHDAVEMSGGKAVIARTGEFRLGPVRVMGLRYYHDRAQGRLRGTTVAYLIEAGGLRVAHLGDIGHVPPPEALEPFRGVDVLALPVGGTYTIDAVEASRIAETLAPKLVVPLHFWMPGMTLPLDPLSRFINNARLRHYRVDVASIELEPPLPGGRPAILIPEKTPTGARVLP